MKKLILLFLFPLLAISCSDEDNISLSKSVAGSDLTEEWCINLVRDHWDCNKGALYNWENNNGTYGHSDYACMQGDEGDIMSKISSLFEQGIDVGESSYKNYILKLYCKDSGGWRYLEVYF